MKFVIADDKWPSREFVNVAVRAIGEVVGEAENGLEAVALCAKHHPDVVILDYSMPVLTGDAAALQILESKTARIVILVTSTRQQIALSRVKAAGAYVLAKMNDTELLRRKVRKIIDGQAEAD